MSTHIKIDPALNIDKERLIGVVANRSIAGETVRLAKGQRFIGDEPGAVEARAALFGEGELTVAELRIDKSDGEPTVNYRFEGIEGIHNAALFKNAEGFEQDFGVLIQRDGETWFVPLSGNEAPAASGEPKRVAPVMNRCGHYHFGLPDEMLKAYGQDFSDTRQTVEEFLAEHDAEPTSGEYALSPLPDGTWRLDASPWMTSASEKEIEVAEEAISALRTAPAPR